MSSLLPIIKSHRAMAKALSDQAHEAEPESMVHDWLCIMSAVHNNAADELQGQMEKGIANAGIVEGE